MTEASGDDRIQADPITITSSALPHGAATSTPPVVSPSTLARPFQLHLFDGRILHGVQFPSGHVAVEDTDRETVVTAMALGALLHDDHNGVVLWPEDLARHSERERPASK